MRGRRAGRAVALAALGALVATGLTGCGVVHDLLGITDSYETTVEWLDDQPILTSVVEITEYQHEGETHGEVRGELDEAATPAEIEAFALEAVAFLDTQDRSDIDLYLGHGEIAFAVDDAASTRRAIPIWQQVELLPALRGALVSGDLVTTRALRIDAAGIVDALETLGVDYRVESLTDEAAFETDVPPGAYAGRIDDRVVGTVLRGDGCTPQDGVLPLALDLIEAGASGVLGLCTEFAINSLEPVGQAAIALRARLDADGIAGLPVTMSQVRLVDYDVRERTVSVAPGSADALAVVRDIEHTAVLGDDASFTLDESGDLTVSDYDVSASRLAALVVDSPAMASLRSVAVFGEDWAATAGPTEFAALADATSSLAAAASALDYVRLEPETLLLSLPDDDASSPPEADARAAAEALDDSGLWESRQTSVRWDGADLVIDSGDAAELTGRAARAEPLTWFRDAWVALHP